VLATNDVYDAFVQRLPRFIADVTRRTEDRIRQAQSMEIDNPGSSEPSVGGAAERKRAEGSAKRSTGKGLAIGRG
jgi:hypothetical protein